MEMVSGDRLLLSEERQNPQMGNSNSLQRAWELPLPRWQEEKRAQEMREGTHPRPTSQSVCPGPGRAGGELVWRLRGGLGRGTSLLQPCAAARED